MPNTPTIDAVPTASPTLTSENTDPGPDARYTPPPVDRTATTVLKRIRAKEKVVFLTIDDGGPRADTKAARVLARRQVPLTQFLITDLISDNTDFYAGVAESDGQVIQNHTVDHVDMTTLSQQQQRDQICSASADLKAWFGTRPWLFRPPFGELDQNTRTAAAQCGIKYLVLWTVNMPEGGKGKFLYNRGDRFRPGDIVLIHWRPKLEYDLRRGLAEIRRQGFRVAALQDYLPRN